MTAQEAHAKLDQHIDICADLHDDLSWTNAEVLEMLIDIGLAWDAPDHEIRARERLELIGPPWTVIIPVEHRIVMCPCGWRSPCHEAKEDAIRDAEQHRKTHTAEHAG